MNSLYLVLHILYGFYAILSINSLDPCRFVSTSFNSLIKVCAENQSYGINFYSEFNKLLLD